MSRLRRTTYEPAGVKSSQEETGLKALLEWVSRTERFRSGAGSSALSIGYFSNVIDLGGDLGLAITTDGVGTKVLIAQMLSKYDTIGIDCIAMNVNDLICVGATPLSLVDYLAVEVASPELLSEIGKGLYEGARLARITIVGGELAQLRDVIRGEREGTGFDLAATCVGTVPLTQVNTGADIAPGDVVLGLRSSGMHSNGFTLARRILLELGGLSLDKSAGELGRTLGGELLEPTRIYVPEARALQESEIRPKALANITGDGLLNLARVQAPVGFILDQLPEPHSIFKLIQAAGSVSDTEMFKVFNMGIGFCVVVDPADVVEAIRVIEGSSGVQVDIIGHAVEDPRRTIVLPEHGLVSSGSAFHVGTL